MSTASREPPWWAIHRVPITLARRLAGFGLAVTLGFAAGACTLSLFATLTHRVLRAETMAIDGAVLEALRADPSPALDRAARTVSVLGMEGVLLLFAGGLVWLGGRRRWGTAVSLVVVTIGAQLLNNLLKAWFHRTRPGPVDALIPAQIFSFPSGHAMLASAFYTFVAVLVWRELGGWRRWAAVGGLVLVVVLVGWSRLYLGVHYLTDVVAGYLAGFLWADSVLIARRLLVRGRREAPESS